MCTLRALSNGIGEYWNASTRTLLVMQESGISAKCANMLNVAVCAFSSTSRYTDQTRSFPCDRCEQCNGLHLRSSFCLGLHRAVHSLPPPPPPHLPRDLCSSPTCGISTPGWNQKQMAKRRERLNSKLRLKWQAFIFSPTGWGGGGQWSPTGSHNSDGVT